MDAGPLERYLAILELISSSSVGVSKAEIGQTLGLPRTSTLRLVDNLMSAGMIRESNRSGTLVPGPRMVQMFETDRSWLDRDVRPLLQRLSDRIGLTVFLARLIGHRVQSVLREQPAVQTGAMASPGYDFPADCTATGRVICAFNPVSVQRRVFAAIGKHGGHVQERALYAAVRAQGYAAEQGEHVPGRLTLAVPVHPTSGPGVEFALGLVAPFERLPEAQWAVQVEALADCARQISGRLPHLDFASERAVRKSDM